MCIRDRVYCDELRILYGRDYYMEEILGLKFKVSAFSFFQTNVEAVEKLYSYGLSLLDDFADKTVFDLYLSLIHILHRLNRSVEEVLYSAMEDFALDIIIGKGPSARSIRLDIARFTLIGATTRVGSLSAPLRDRFGVSCKFEIYQPDELKQIIRRSAEILGVTADEASLDEMAKRSRGTPRVANRMLRRVRDFSQVKGSGTIDMEITRRALEALGVDEMGLEGLDREILKTIIERFNGGPVGIDTIAASIGEERVTIEAVSYTHL